MAPFKSDVAGRADGRHIDGGDRARCVRAGHPSDLCGPVNVATCCAGQHEAEHGARVVRHRQTIREPLEHFEACHLATRWCTSHNLRVPESHVAWIELDVVMGLAASAWYTSGTFWSAVAAVGTIAAAIIGLVTFRAQFPRRRIVYGFQSLTRLIDKPVGVRELEVLHKGKRLGDPYVAEVALLGKGRRDIPSGSFDQGKPIRLHLGAPIVEWLSVSGDSGLDTFEILGDGGEIAIGPCLIGRRQRIVFSLLLDGEPSLGCDHALVDVDVRGPVDDLPRVDIDKPVWVLRFVPPVMALAVIGFLVTDLYQSGSNFAQFAFGFLVSAILTFVILQFSGRLRE